FFGQQPRVIVALDHVQDVGVDIFARAIPGISGSVRALTSLYAAYAQTLALAQGVKSQAHVAAQLLPFGSLDRPLFGGQIAIQKLAKRPLTDKTDAGRIFFTRIGQTKLCRDTTHFGL